MAAANAWHAHRLIVCLCADLNTFLQVKSEALSGMYTIASSKPLPSKPTVVSLFSKCSTTQSKTLFNVRNTYLNLRTHLEHMKKAFDALREGLDIEQEEEANLFLGCKHTSDLFAWMHIKRKEEC